MIINTNLETIVCPNCNCDSWKVVARAKPHSQKIEGEFSIVRCDSCGLKYLNPRPNEKSLGRYYETIQQSSISENNILTTAKKGFLRKLWLKINYSNPLIPMIDCEPVLDIGCGRGELLSELSEKGYDASGLEFNSQAVKECLLKGLKVNQGNVNDFELPKGHYKCIVLSHALEHFSDPVSVLRKLRNALSSGGKIVIAVPYGKSLMINLFGNSWHGWDPPFHLVHFDKSTIRQICKKAGLQIKIIKVGGHPEDFTRSWAIWSGKSQRYLILRAALWPFFLVATAFGQGSYLLVSAEVK